MDIYIEHLFQVQIGTGENILFWLEDWTGEGDLAFRLPLLFKLDKRKSSFIADRVRGSAVAWDWKRKPKSASEVNELQILNCLMDGIVGEDQQEGSNFKLSGDGKFKVCNLRALIAAKITTPRQNPTIWLYLVPLKIICFVWRVCFKSIPTTRELETCGVQIRSSVCQLCHQGIEDSDHLFIDCPFSAEIPLWVINWCDIAPSHFPSAFDMVNFAASWG